MLKSLLKILTYGFVAFFLIPLVSIFYSFFHGKKDIGDKLILKIGPNLAFADTPPPPPPPGGGGGDDGGGGGGDCDDDDDDDDC